MNYMVTELKSSREDVNLMREALKEEGWRENADLPEGWMVGEGRKNGKEKPTTKRLATDEYVSLGSLKLAVRHLLLHFPQEVLTKFLASFVLRLRLNCVHIFVKQNFVLEVRQSCWTMSEQIFCLSLGKSPERDLRPV